MITSSLNLEMKEEVLVVFSMMISYLMALGIRHSNLLKKLAGLLLIVTMLFWKEEKILLMMIATWNGNKFVEEDMLNSTLSMIEVLSLVYLLLMQESSQFWWVYLMSLNGNICIKSRKDLKKKECKRFLLIPLIGFDYVYLEFFIICNYSIIL